MSRKDELISAYLDDALTEAGHAELNAWMKADVANVSRFVEATAREHQLRIVVQARCEFRRPVVQKTVHWRSALAWAVAAMVLIGGITWLLQPTVGAKAHLSGNLDGVTVERAGSNLKAHSNLDLQSGDVVISTRTGARIEFEDENTQFSLSDASSVALWSLRGQKCFELLAGRVSAEVAKQREGAMIWLTEDAKAQVLGTRFELSADWLLTTLDVREGAVRFQGRNATTSTVVDAGYTAATDSRGLRKPDLGAIWNTPGRTVSGCDHVTFHSDEIGADIGVNVLLPPDYATQPGRRFPVLYFHHALGADEHREAAALSPLLLAAMEGETLPHCIVIFPNGGPGDTPRPIVSGRVFAGELPRFIDHFYRTQANAGSRIICGTGFGGKRAILFGTLDGDVFGAACAINDTFHGGTQSFFRIIDTMQRRIDRFPPHLLLLRTENSDDSSVNLVAELRNRGINIDYQSLASASTVTLVRELCNFVDGRWKR